MFRLKIVTVTKLTYLRTTKDCILETKTVQTGSQMFKKLFDRQVILCLHCLDELQKHCNHTIFIILPFDFEQVKIKIREKRNLLCRFYFRKLNK